MPANPSAAGNKFQLDPSLFSSQADYDNEVKRLEQAQLDPRGGQGGQVPTTIPPLLPTAQGGIPKVGEAGNPTPFLNAGSGGGGGVGASNPAGAGFQPGLGGESGSSSQGSLAVMGLNPYLGKRLPGAPVQALSSLGNKIY